MNSKNRKLFIDASLFMGMHSADEETRRQSVWLMSTYFSAPVHMNLEQVGLCDEYVWQYERSVQDAYYPFMDVLHSEMDVKRIGYCDGDLDYIYRDYRFENSTLTLQQKLLMAQVVNHHGLLYTHDKSIRSVESFEPFLGEFEGKTGDLHRGKPIFSELLDTLYEASRCLIFPFINIPHGGGNYAE